MLIALICNLYLQNQEKKTQTETRHEDSSLRKLSKVSRSSSFDEDEKDNETDAGHHFMETQTRR